MTLCQGLMTLAMRKVRPMVTTWLETISSCDDHEAGTVGTVSQRRVP
jgi:hypothetical protein